MLTKPTVLVLGAGASMPLGFPSGEELVSRILMLMEEESAGRPLDRIRRAMETGHPRDVLAEAIGVLEPYALIDSFWEALFYSGRQSIDTFLEHNPDFLAIGKMAIAAVLVPLEDQQRLFSAKGNWYRTLFNCLNTRFEEFAENKLSILTYNYDRSLEQFLLTALRHSYQGMKGEHTECCRQLSRIPIIHLHGTLGELPHGGPGALDNLERPYESRLTPRDLTVCAQTIRVVSEGTDSQPQFQLAHGLLRDADVLCFLGFGWDPTNLSRLQVNTPENWKPTRMRYGTAYKKGDAERDWIHQYFGHVGGIEVGNRAQDIEDFLADFPVLS